MTGKWRFHDRGVLFWLKQNTKHSENCFKTVLKQFSNCFVSDSFRCVVLCGRLLLCCTCTSACWPRLETTWPTGYNGRAASSTRLKPNRGPDRSVQRKFSTSLGPEISREKYCGFLQKKIAKRPTFPVTMRSKKLPNLLENTFAIRKMKSILNYRRTLPLLLWVSVKHFNVALRIYRWPKNLAYFWNCDDVI